MGPPDPLLCAIHVLNTFALHQRYFAPKVNTLHHCCYEPEVHTLLPCVPHPPLVQITTSTRRSLLGLGTQCCYAHSHLAAEYIIASSILCPTFILKLYHSAHFPLSKWWFYCPYHPIPRFAWSVGLSFTKKYHTASIWTPEGPREVLVLYIVLFKKIKARGDTKKTGFFGNFSQMSDHPPPFWETLFSKQISFNIYFRSLGAFLVFTKMSLFGHYSDIYFWE